MIVSTILVVLFFRNISKQENIEEDSTSIQKSKEGVIVTISREHGSQGKYIGKLVANKLNISYYYKEMTAIAAQESGLDREFISKINQSNNIMHDLYLTTTPVQYAIDAQNKAIQNVINYAKNYHIKLVKIIPSPIQGNKKHNQEYIGWFACEK